MGSFTGSTVEARGVPIGGAGIYWRLVLASIRSQMQYKISFLLGLLGQLFSTGLEIVGIWALFSRFGGLENWSLPQILVFYGIVNISFSIADALSTGFDRFGTDYIRTGHFDRILLRPRSITIQILAHELTLKRIGRFSQGLIVLIWAFSRLEVSLSPLDIGFILYTVAAGVSLFVGIFVIQASLAFWTVESLEIMNALSYGGVESSQYPMSVYEDWFRKAFTYIVPLACVTYFPVLIIINVDDPLGSSRWFQMLAPLSGFVFLSISIFIFRFVGVPRYTSTGN